MNNEQYQQIINEVYERFIESYTRKDGQIILPLSKNRFINRIKTDEEFSKKWGLKIEERELSLEERNDYYTSNYLGLDCDSHEELNKLGDIPTRLITITHNSETIQVYE